MKTQIVKFQCQIISMKISFVHSSADSFSSNYFCPSVYHTQLTIEHTTHIHTLILIVETVDNKKNLDDIETLVQNDFLKRNQIHDTHSAVNCSLRNQHTWMFARRTRVFYCQGFPVELSSICYKLD